MKNVGFLALATVLILVTACGSSGSSPAPTVVYLADIEGTSDVATDVSFGYLFDESVDSTTVTTSRFFMVPTPTSTETSLGVKAAYDSTICVLANAISATITGKTAVSAILNPASALTEGTSYTACISNEIIGLDGVAIDGASFTFTTIGTIVSLSSFSKTSIASTTAGEGEVTFTFVFDSAPTSAPTLAVTLTSDGSAVSSSTCEADTTDTTGKTYTCSATGLESCTTYTDYTATLSGGGLAEDELIAFNSSDDEFTDPDTITTCWINAGEETFTTVGSVEGGNLVCTGSGDPDVTLGKLPPSVSDFALSSYYSANTAETTTGNDDDVLNSAALVHFDNPDLLQFSFQSGFLSDLPADVWLFGWMDFTLPATFNDMAFAVGGGTLSDYTTQIIPIRFCFVVHDNILRTFVNFDETITNDSTWIKLTTGNTAGAGDVTDTSSLVNYDFSSFDLTYIAIAPRLASSVENTVKYGYTRFNTSNIDGTSASCPVLE